MSLHTHKHVIIFVRLAISLFLLPFFDPIISPVFASITAQHFDDTFGGLNSFGTYLLNPGPVFPKGEELPVLGLSCIIEPVSDFNFFDCALLPRWLSFCMEDFLIKLLGLISDLFYFIIKLTHFFFVKNSLMYHRSLEHRL